MRRAGAVETLRPFRARGRGRKKEGADPVHRSLPLSPTGEAASSPLVDMREALLFEMEALRISPTVVSFNAAITAAADWEAGPAD